MGICRDRKLLHYAFGRYTSLLKMTYHLPRRRLGRPVGSSNLHSVVLRVVFSQRGDISSYLTVLELQDIRADMTTGDQIRTWRTVTGKRAPCSSHIAVIPRFRAMTPDRIDCGVHFATFEVEDSVTAFFTALWWIVLQA